MKVRYWLVLTCLAPLASAMAASTGPIVVEDLTSATVTAGATSFDSAVAVTPSDDTTDAVGLFELTNQLQAYQQQIDELRGEIEELNHTIDQMKASARDRYLDLDTRINALSDAAVDDVQTNRSATQQNTSVPSNEKYDPEIDRAAYVAARSKLLNADYEGAHNAFTAYLKDYPNGAYIADAHFWRGELYRIDGQADALEKGIKEYIIIADKYPDADRAPAALEKAADLQIRLQQKNSAKVTLHRIIEQYPNSAAAIAAEKTLKTL